ncbi:sodium:solute symporter [Lentzea sp. NEAU-D13]|uniref:Sodium:solute symporter n=1 Tax=Lentzea alba TaxID=2714351 RepID=A0A7C9W750_9PSEU|nr:sodium:solute symporter [Lentzea alba]NGY64699.1 sodium:solute symporter [Lentzea alba]
MTGVDVPALLTFAAVLVLTSAVAVAARRFYRADVLPTPADWAVAGRRFGTVTTWFLMGGTIYTAYTFVAVPGVVYAEGAIGFFALPYTIIVYPLAFWLLPKLWREARDVGAVTIADVVRVRYDSPGLALAVALTGILVTMPYVALQLLGIRTVLTVLGVYPAGVIGDVILGAVFAVLAVATYRNGLRAAAVIGFLKGVLVFAAIVVIMALLGPPDRLFAEAERRSTGPPDLVSAGVDGGVVTTHLDPGLSTAYVTLAVGSALALLMYPHVLTAAFAARGEQVLRRNSVALLGWTALLGLFALLGVAAHALGVVVAEGRAELAVPTMITQLMPGWAAGAVFGALAIGALVPASIMSVAAAMLFTRNVYVEYVNPNTTPKQQTSIARFVSLLVKFGALGFALLLAAQDTINLQLLGGVWVLQTFPAVVLGALTRRLSPAGMLAGWAVGMLTGTLLVTSGGFSAVVVVGGLQVYAAVIALAANLVVAFGVSAVWRR